MPNTTLSISLITNEAMFVLENNLQFFKLVNRNFDNKYGVEGAKIGTTLNVRLPPRYTVSTGQALSVQNFVETQVPVVLNRQLHVDVEFSSQELLLNIDDFSTRVLKPAISALANEIDRLGLQQYNTVYNIVGTPATIPSAILTYLQAKAFLDEEAAPVDDQRSIVVGPRMEITIVDALKALFHESTQIDQGYLKGRMGVAAGFTWLMDQNVPTHTVGTQGGTPLVNGAGQSGATIDLDGWTGSVTNVLRQGDVFTIAGVNAVNPQSRVSTGQLRRFVVTANQNSTAAGATADVPISPSITASGAQQTVDSTPADNAAITVVGASAAAGPQGLAFHRDAFTCAAADLPLPKDVDMGARKSDEQLGLSIRLIRKYDINTDQWPTRMDSLIGWATLRPELAVRIAS